MKQTKEEKKKGLVPVSDEVMNRLNAPKKVKERRNKEFIDEITGTKIIKELEKQIEDLRKANTELLEMKFYKDISKYDKKIEQLIQDVELEKGLKEDYLEEIEELKEDNWNLKEEIAFCGSVDRKRGNSWSAKEYKFEQEIREFESQLQNKDKQIEELKKKLDNCERQPKQSYKRD